MVEKAQPITYKFSYGTSPNYRIADTSELIRRNIDQGNNAAAQAAESTFLPSLSVGFSYYKYPRIEPKSYVPLTLYIIIVILSIAFIVLYIKKIKEKTTQDIVAISIGFSLFFIIYGCLIFYACYTRKNIWAWLGLLLPITIAITLVILLLLHK